MKIEAEIERKIILLEVQHSTNRTSPPTIEFNILVFKDLLLLNLLRGLEEKQTGCVIAIPQLRALDHNYYIYTSKIFHLKSGIKSVVFSAISHLQMVELTKST